MLSKEERKKVNEEFWGKFKKYSRSYKSASGKAINWLNYPTHTKQIYIRLLANTKMAKFSIDIQDKDEAIRLLVWEQFIELKKVLMDEMIEEGNWQFTTHNKAGQEISEIAWVLNDVNQLNTQDEEKIFHFFMQYLTRFDRFYCTYDEILIHLLK